MNTLNKKMILPLTFSSFLSMNAALAGDQMERAGEDVEKAYEHTEQAAENTAEKIDEGSEHAWKETKEKSKEAWGKTKEVTNDVWQGTKHLSKKAWGSSKEAFEEGVIAGRLETALVMSKELNPFEIDFEVKDRKVVLSGTVESNVDKELAEHIAEGVKGVKSVKNNIDVDSNIRSSNVYDTDGDQDRDFGQYFSDITTTAWVKTQLLANNEVSGLDINVDTVDDRIVLSGTVDSITQKAIAETIANKRDGVIVVNKLNVKS